MNASFKKVLFLGFMATTLAACQSAPETEGLDDTDVVTAEQQDQSTETYGAGDRSGIDGMSMGQDDMTAGDSQYSQGDMDLLSTSVFYFDFDQSTIKSDSLEALRAHAQYLNENPNARVRLEGHADERGTREYNVALGERRGNAVAKYLRLNGVSSSKMEVISYGEEKPVAYGHDDQSWSANRRVEIVYTAGQP
ncbi:MAG: peptidoglycan-associated lipoprotein Pal [Pseudomonadota bacterium]|nr:peptidoglycan-associated lipoprotein Pal [Pseudomonadota bacterium]|tara:strand:+ start:281 stop:862 length:582 start_codon:yes stop_codon:yes gene_type:complete